MYGARRQNRYEHAREIRDGCGYRGGGGLSLKAGLPSAAQGGTQAQADSCETFEGGDLIAGFRSGWLAQVVAAGGLRSQERQHRHGQSGSLAAMRPGTEGEEDPGFRRRARIIEPALGLELVRLGVFPCVAVGGVGADENGGPGVDGVAGELSLPRGAPGQ